MEIKKERPNHTVSEFPNTNTPTIDELVGKFKNFEKRYHNSPAFNIVIQQLIRGVNPYEVIDSLCQTVDDTQNAFTDYVRSDNRPMVVRTSANDTFIFNDLNATNIKP